jgi:uncharacterized RDD family membrane protein YckC
MVTNVEKGSVALGRTAVRTKVITGPAAEPAPFALRCGALIIDYILVVGVIAISTIVARMLGGGARVAGSSAQLYGILIALFLLVADFVLLPAVAGLTVGKWVTGLRIERNDQGELGVGRAILRHFVGYPFSFLTLGLGFLLPAFTSRGRALHDLIAGTVVVRQRELPLPRPHVR